MIVDAISVDIIKNLKNIAIISGGIDMVVMTAGMMINTSMKKNYL